MPASKFAAAHTYTPEEQLAIWSQASAEVGSVGYSRAITGRTLTKANWSEIERAIAFWEKRTDAVAGAASAINYVQLGRR